MRRCQVWLLACTACTGAPSPPAPPSSGQRFEHLSTPTPEGARSLIFVEASKELVALFELSGRVQFYSGLGGRLIETSATAFARGSRALTQVDVDGDGSFELAAAQSGASSLSVLRRNGDGAWVTASTATTARAPLDLAAGDLDGDGQQDLVTVTGLDEATTSVEAWHGLPLVALGAPIALSAAFSVAMYDLDSDGDRDVVVTRMGEASLSVLENVGSGAPRLVSTIPCCPSPSSPRASDLDGDGRPELIVPCRSGGLDLIAGDLFATPVASSTEHLDFDAVVYDAVAADLDGDGSPDLAAVDVRDHRVIVWRAKGDGQFGAPITYPVSKGPISVIAADLDDDRDLDLAVSAFEGRTIDVFLAE